MNEFICRVFLTQIWNRVCWPLSSIKKFNLTFYGFRFPDSCQHFKLWFHLTFLLQRIQRKKKLPNFKYFQVVHRKIWQSLKYRPKSKFQVNSSCFHNIRLIIIPCPKVDPITRPSINKSHLFYFTLLAFIAQSPPTSIHLYFC